LYIESQLKQANLSKKWAFRPSEMKKAPNSDAWGLNDDKQRKIGWI